MLTCVSKYCYENTPHQLQGRFHTSTLSVAVVANSHTPKINLLTSNQAVTNGNLEDAIDALADANKVISYLKKQVDRTHVNIYIYMYIYIYICCLRHCAVYVVF
jgi:hypothetical protein